MKTKIRIASICSFILLLAFATNAYAKKPSFSLSKKKATLYVGDELKLSVVGVGRSSVSWSSSNKRVASVKNGVVRAKRKGTAKITAKVGKRKRVCKIKVKSVGKGKDSTKLSDYVSGGRLVLSKISVAPTSETAFGTRSGGFVDPLGERNESFLLWKAKLGKKLGLTAYLFTNSKLYPMDSDGRFPVTQNCPLEIYLIEYDLSKKTRKHAEMDVRIVSFDAPNYKLFSSRNGSRPLRERLSPVDQSNPLPVGTKFSVTYEFGGITLVVPYVVVEFSRGDV